MIDVFKKLLIICKKILLFLKKTALLQYDNKKFNVIAYSMNH
jgi:hypothetical protein